MAEQNLAGNTTGVEHEIEFWKEFVQSERFKTNWLASPNPEMALYPELQKAITEKIPGPVLDLGCGVVSYLHGSCGASHLYTCDPLADRYAEFFNYHDHGILQPIAVAGEELTYVFDNNFFALAHMSNALDHCKDPVRVVDQIQLCLKPGGTLIVQGFENEGDFEGWTGLHQWNLTVDQKKLYLYDRSGLKYTWVAVKTWRRRIESGKIWIGAKFRK